MTIHIHNEEALQEFADLARRGGEARDPYGHGRADESVFFEAINLSGQQSNVAFGLPVIERADCPPDTAYIIDLPAIHEELRYGKPFKDAVKNHAAKIDFGQKRKFL